MHQIRLKPRIRPVKWLKVQKCLPCKPDRLSSIIRTNIKEPVVMAYLYNSITAMAKWEVKLGESPIRSWARSPGECSVADRTKENLPQNR